MIRKLKLVMITVCGAMLICMSAVAQDPPATILSVVVEHNTIYIGDVSDYNKLAADPNQVPAASGPPKAFSTIFVIGDIVEVNGKSAKGTMLEHITWFGLSPIPGPGKIIADTFRGGLYDFNFEIQQEDGTPIGSTRSGGVGQGVPPPGAIQEIAFERFQPCYQFETSERR